MQKKWSIVLMIVNIACLLAVTTVSVVVWAVNEKNKSVTGNGTITIPADAAISAQMTAGKQVSGGALASMSGTVGGDETELTNVDLQNLSAFSIGDITVSHGKYVNIYFTVKNTSADKLKVAVHLTDGDGEAFNQTDVVSSIYTTESNIDTALLDELNWASTEFDTTSERLNGRNDIHTATDYLVYRSIIPYDNINNYLQVSANGTQTVIVRYDIGASAANFDIGINLTFSV